MSCYIFFSSKIQKKCLIHLPKNNVNLIYCMLLIVFLIITESIFNITIPYIYDAKKVEDFDQIPSTTNGKYKLKTVGGTAFDVFAKSSKFNKGTTKSMYNLYIFLPEL